MEEEDERIWRIRKQNKTCPHILEAKSEPAMPMVVCWDVGAAETRPLSLLVPPPPPSRPQLSVPTPPRRRGDGAGETKHTPGMYQHTNMASAQPSTVILYKMFGARFWSPDPTQTTGFLPQSLRECCVVFCVQNMNTSGDGEWGRPPGHQPSCSVFLQFTQVDQSSEGRRQASAATAVSAATAASAAGDHRARHAVTSLTC